MENETTEHFGGNYDNTVSFAKLDIYQRIQTVNYVGISQVFGLMGLVTNIINMIVFITIGFKDTINISLFVLSLSDFGTCLLGSLECIFANPWFRVIDLTFDPVAIGYFLLSWPRIVFTQITTLVTAFISFERCLCVALPLKVKTIITRGRVKTLMACMCAVVLGTSAPFYYYNRIALTFYPHLNKSIYSLAFTDDREKIQRVYLPIFSFSYTIFPFVLIVIFTAILVINLQRKATWRKTATTVTTTNRDSTKEMRISKTVITISSLFIVCNSPLVVATFYLTTDPNYSILGSKAHILLTVASFIHVCQLVNASVNIFVYYHNTSAYKSMFGSIFYSNTVSKR